MTLPRPRRKVVLGGVTYPYILRASHSRFKGQSPIDLTLTVQIGKAYMSVTLLSKHWREEHAEGWMLPHHKATLKPSDVVKILSTFLKTGKPEDLPDWSVHVWKTSISSPVA